MTKVPHARRWVALIAAYAVVLQTALMFAALAVELPGAVICSSASTGAPATPSNHDNGCGCAAGCGTLCCAQALASPPGIALPLGQTGTVSVAVVSPVAFDLPKLRYLPQSPRPPPVA
jgi:hypothetical protein